MPKITIINLAVWSALLNETPPIDYTEHVPINTKHGLGYGLGLGFGGGNGLGYGTGFNSLGMRSKKGVWTYHEIDNF